MRSCRQNSVAWLAGSSAATARCLHVLGAPSWFAQTALSARVQVVPGHEVLALGTSSESTRL